MSISRHFGRCTAWIVDRPVWAYVLLALLSGVATLGYVAPDRVRSLFLPKPEEVAAPVTPPAAAPARARPNVESFDLTGAEAVLVIESDSIFTPDGAAALRHMVERLEARPSVASVTWMDRVPVLNIFGLREPLFPKSQASPARFAAAREKAMQHPLVKGQLLSPDGRTLIVLVNFNWLYVTEDADCIANLKRAAEEALAEYPRVKFFVGVTGWVPIRLTLKDTHERSELKFRVIGYGVVLIMAAVLFRGVGSVLMVSLGPALGIFWTQGFLNFFNLQDNPFNDVVLPVMLSLVGLADGVHLMVQIRRFRAAGMSERDAAAAGLEEVGLACFLTAITTSIGFWSLTLAQHEIVNEFGWSCVLGVLLTVVSILTVIPLACFSWLGRLVPIQQREGLIESHLHRLEAWIDFVLKRPKPIAWGGIALTVLCAALAAQLRPDERRSSFLPDSAEVTKALRQMDKAMGGLEFSEVQVYWKPEVENPADVLRVIAEVDDLLKTEPLIGTPISIRNFVDALPGEGPTVERASMLELLPPPLKRAFYKPEDHQASVTFRVRDIGIAQYSEVFERVEARLQEMTQRHPQFSLSLAGSAVWRWRDLYRVTVDLGSSLGSETIIIIIILGIVFRSIRLGLIALVPNVFPLVVCGTWMYLTGQALEIVTVCCFTICLGIAVDDTIHFLTRFEEELPRSASRKEAIRNTFKAVGTSMIMTSIVLIVGFSTVTFSDMRDQRVFASMGMLTMVTAMVGDLVILPALLAVYARPVPGEVTGTEIANLTSSEVPA